MKLRDITVFNISSHGVASTLYAVYGLWNSCMIELSLLSHPLTRQTADSWWHISQKSMGFGAVTASVHGRNANQYEGENSGHGSTVASALGHSLDIDFQVARMEYVSSHSRNIFRCKHSNPSPNTCADHENTYML